jgi:hypothetical protein
MNPAELDTKEELKLLADELTKRVGYPVVVDKIANRFTVHRVYRTTKLKAEVIEQVLLASELPVVDVFMKELRELDLSVECVKLPKKGVWVSFPDACVAVGRPCMAWTKTDRFEDFSCRNVWEWGFCEGGWVKPFTISSSKGLAKDETRFELKQELFSILHVLQRGGEDVTLFVLDDLKDYEDPELGVAQSWADIFILKGKWTYADGRFQQL